MITNQRKPKLAFIVATDKAEKFLNVKTDSLQDAINKSKEYRKKLMEKAEKTKCINMYQK